jgi:hypothetical protein
MKGAQLSDEVTPKIGVVGLHFPLSSLQLGAHPKVLVGVDVAVCGGRVMVPGETLGMLF